MNINNTSENTKPGMTHSASGTMKNNTVKDAFCHSRIVFHLLKEITEDLAKLKGSKEDIEAALKSSSTKVGLENDETVRKLKPMFDELLKNLCVQISLQKQENGKLLQKVSELKREKNNLQQMIIGCAKKCAQMEEELGKYPN